MGDEQKKKNKNACAKRNNIKKNGNAQKKKNPKKKTKTRLHKKKNLPPSFSQCFPPQNNNFILFPPLGPFGFPASLLSSSSLAPLRFQLR